MLVIRGAYIWGAYILDFTVCLFSLSVHDCNGRPNDNFEVIVCFSCLSNHKDV